MSGDLSLGIAFDGARAVIVLEKIDDWSLGMLGKERISDRQEEVSNVSHDFTPDWVAAKIHFTTKNARPSH